MITDYPLVVPFPPLCRNSTVTSHTLVGIRSPVYTDVSGPEVREGTYCLVVTGGLDLRVALRPVLGGVVEVTLSGLPSKFSELP